MKHNAGDGLFMKPSNKEVPENVEKRNNDKGKWGFAHCIH